MPIVALIVAMLAMIVLVNVLRPAERTSLSAGVLSAGALSLPAIGSDAPDPAPDTAAAEQADEIADEVADEEPEDAEPTATAVPTTAPVTVPTLAPAVDIDGRGSRPAAVDSSAVPASSAPTATATSIPATPTAVQATATAVPVATSTPVPEPTATPVPPATATPLPAATATPFPTATPAPAATATPLPVVTATAVPTATPFPTNTPLPVFTMSTSDMEIYTLNAINGVRARAGLSALQLDSSISGIARDWSQQMANVGRISHRPQNQLSAMLPANWRGWAENVAQAPTIQEAQTALEGSSGHYVNMVGDYNVIGIGVAIGNNGIFVTHNFAKYEN